MSRATIRRAIAARLAPPTVAGIRTVYPSLPKIIPGTAFFAGEVGSTSGCVAAINIVSDRERRIAIGGAHSGRKRVDYTVDIQLFYRRIAAATVDEGDAGIVAQDDFDAIVDTLKDWIRADRTAASSDIWQWGEAELGGRYGPLVEDQNGAHLWGAVRTQVTEWLTT